MANHPGGTFKSPGPPVIFFSSKSLNYPNAAQCRAKDS
jgi:hypothetical protein